MFDDARFVGLVVLHNFCSGRCPMINEYFFCSMQSRVIKIHVGFYLLLYKFRAIRSYSMLATLVYNTGITKFRVNVIFVLSHYKETVCCKTTRCFRNP